MINIADKSKCSGCHACYNACPKQCINMRRDDEGFLYPEVNEKLCINCGLCEKVCPILKEYVGHPKGEAYACTNMDEEIRMKSSSGGVFTLIAEYVLDKCGVVFGAGFDDDFNVRHTIAYNKADLEKLRGSKYVQSTIGDAYKKAEEYLKSGQPVLFTGTPCQISGLYSYLKKDYDNLITQDIVCHGVPSQYVWQKYLEFVNKEKSQINRVSFRDKRNGWSKYNYTFYFGDGSEFSERASDNMMSKAFLQNLCLRPSCYQCHSKSIKRESDITLADFWGIENVLPEMNDDKGTSLMLINSHKGQALFDKVSSGLKYKKVDFDEAVKSNSSISKSVELKSQRKKFMELYNKTDFDKALNMSTKRSFIRKVAGKIKREIKNIINGGK